MIGHTKAVIVNQCAASSSHLMSLTTMSLPPHQILNLRHIELLKITQSDAYEKSCEFECG